MTKQRFALICVAGFVQGCRSVPALAVALLLAACGSGEPDFEALTELAFGDGTIRIDWLEGDAESDAASIRVVLLEAESERLLYEAGIANEGVALTPGNVRPGVGPLSELTLCLNGTGQADVSVRINPKTNTIIESDQACAL